MADENGVSEVTESIDTASIDEEQTTESIKLSEENTDDQGSKETAEAPETYEEFTMPEGVEVDGELLGSASDMFKADGLSQERAQEYISMYAKSQEDAVAGIAKQHTDQVAQWTAATKSDNEIGGAKLNENTGLAKLALQTLGKPELTQYLDETGLSNHPEIMRLLVNAGSMLKEDNPGTEKAATGTTHQSTEHAQVDALYSS